jgi:hypothetical protein
MPAPRLTALQLSFTLSIGMLLFVIGNVAGQPCTPLPTGIVSWWRAETNTLDQIGGNTGTNAGSVAYGSGQVAKGFVLAGNGAAVRVGNPASLRLTNFTIECWIARASAAEAGTTGAGYADLFAFGTGGYAFGLNDSGMLFLTNVGSSGVMVSAGVADTSFHHVAVTKSGSMVNFYVDGGATTAPPYGGSFTFSTSAALGARGDTLAASFYGTIDDLAIYNRALSSDEIQAIFDAGSSGKCSASTGPFIFTPPTDQISTALTGARFSVTAGGTSPLRYQWVFNGTNLPGMTNATLTLGNLQYPQAGPYAVQITNSYGGTTSSIAFLTVNPPSTCINPSTGLVSWWRAEFDAVDAIGTNHGTLIQDAGYAPAEAGEGFAFDGYQDGVAVGSAANLRLQNFTIEAWIQRASPTVLNLGGGPTLDALFFSFGTGGYGFGLEATGRPLLSKIETDGVIVNAPITDTGWHHVAVTKSGSTLVFYVDGVAYPAGPYGSTFTFSTPAAIGFRSDTGANSFFGIIDEIAVFNRALSQSEISAIYIEGAGGKCPPSVAPIITAPPQSVTTVAGTNVTFSVGVTGYPPLAYQWQFGSTNISGAINSALNLLNVQLVNAGNYRLIVTNNFGGATSAVATLTIQSPPIINTQPQSLTNFPGVTVEFVVVFSGTPPFFFQWQHGGTNVIGAKDYSLVLTNIQATDAGIYSVTITNAFGSVTSAPAVLTLYLPPLITNQPVSQAAPMGANPIFTVGASGFGPFHYQWVHENTNLPGATNAILAIHNVQPSNAGSYAVIVTNSFGPTSSSNAFLTVTNPVCFAPPSGLLAWWQAEDSADDSVAGSTGELIGSTSYTNGKIGRAFSFNGNKSGVNIGPQPNLRLQDFTIEVWARRASTNAVNLGPGPTLDALFFSFGLNGYGFGLTSSNRLFLSKISVDNFVGGPVVADKEFHHMAVTKFGTSVVFYLDGVAYPAGAYGSTFSFSSVAAVGFRADTSANSFFGDLDEVGVYGRALGSAEIQALYYAQSQGKCPFPLSWVAQPTSQSVPLGSNATFVAAVAGSRPAALQWYFNSAVLDRATNSVLNLPAVNYFQAGPYNFSATNQFGGFLSTNAMLTILPPPLITNGSFEAGPGQWILTDIFSPLIPLAVRATGYYPGFGFFTTTASDGNFCLTDGFDGNGPGRIRAAFDVVVPPSPVTLTFDYRLAWDMQNYDGSTKSRTFTVAIEPYGGGAGLQTNTIFTALAGTANYDTGNLTSSVDLSGFAGRAIRVSFDQNIPESFTGPGFFQLDNVRLSSFAVPPLLISRNGSNAVLSWPLMFSNFTTLSATSLVAPITWTQMPTNPILRTPTNAILIVPVTPGDQFYRLRSY